MIRLLSESTTYSRSFSLSTESWAGWSKPSGGAISASELDGRIGRANGDRGGRARRRRRTRGRSRARRRTGGGRARRCARRGRRSRHERDGRDRCAALGLRCQAALFVAARRCGQPQQSCHRAGGPHPRSPHARLSWRMSGWMTGESVAIGRGDNARQLRGGLPSLLSPGRLQAYREPGNRSAEPWRRTGGTLRLYDARPRTGTIAPGRPRQGRGDPMRGLNDKVAAVTGAASGIGRATAIRLGEEGASVACLDLQLGAAEETAKTITASGGQAFALSCDVADPADGAAAIAAVVERYGHLDVLCNVAGIGHFADDRTESLEWWNRIIAVNLTGTFLMSQAALPHLLKSKGTIVNTASTAGIKGQPWSSAYSASKGGVIALTPDDGRQLGPPGRAGQLRGAGRGHHAHHRAVRHRARGRRSRPDRPASCRSRASVARRAGRGVRVPRLRRSLLHQRLRAPRRRRHAHRVRGQPDRSRARPGTGCSGPGIPHPHLVSRWSRGRRGGPGDG